MHHARTFTRQALLAFVCLLCCLTAAQAQTTQSPLPAATGWVNDYAGIIDPATKSRMETMLTNLKQRANIEFAVATVRTTGEQPIFDYSLAVARGWGIGASDSEKNGLLLLVAVDDRKYQIQVSRHLEGDLPDGLVGEIGRRMREQFRQNRYSDGVMLAVQTFIATLAEKRGFSIEGIDQNLAYRPRRAVPEQDFGRGVRTATGGLSSGMCCLIILVIIVLMLIFGRGGRGGRGGGGGCLQALLLANLFSSMGGGGRRSSGWGGGGFGGGGWGGGGGGGGGFGGFGGGGDFGGGGAGGSW